MSILISVKSFRTLLTLVLVALWPLATSHCDLEQLPGFAFFACTEESPTAAPHQDNDCETDSCASIESGFYKTEDSQQVPTPPLALSELLTAVLVTELSSVSNFDPETIPLELSRNWQFSLRAALPPRAPSFVS